MYFLKSRYLDKLDKLAICVLISITIIHCIIFPLHNNLLYPDELYDAYSSNIRPRLEDIPKTRNLSKLLPGIEHSSAALKLPNTGKLFCFVETSTVYYSTRARAIAETWLPRCDNGRFFTKTHMPYTDIPYSTVYRNLEDSYYDLFRKTFFGFYYSYQHISDKFDWYLKADDDNYFVMDNLKSYLDTLDPSIPYYLGYRLKPFLKDGYNSGGAGYVLSNAAVRIFATKLYSNEKLCPYDWSEDRAIGRCLASLGIVPQDTRDSMGYSRFNAFHMKEIPTVLPQYHYYPLKNRSLSSISEDFISLHRVSPDKMILLDKILHPEKRNDNFRRELLDLF